MSGHEKHHDSYLYGYASTQPGQDQSYAGPAQPTFTPRYQSTQVDEPHALVSTSQMPFLGQPFEPRDTGFQAASAALIDTRTRLSPEITSAGPYTGTAGEIFRLNVRSKSDYTEQNILFTLLFGSTAVAASLTKNSHRDPYYHYTLETTIPTLLSPQTLPTMALLLEMADENGHSMHMKALENFTYLDTSSFPRYPATLEVQKKRKYADDTSGYSQISAKRSASTPLQPKGQGIYPPVSDTSAYNFDSNVDIYSLPTAYDRPIAQPRSYGPHVAQRPTYQYPGSPPVQHIGKSRSTSVSGYGGYPSIARPSPSPRLSAASQVPASHHERVSSVSSNPPLIRTSILQPQAPTSFRPPGFNPYTIYPTTKAKLEIQGDLLSMCQDWTPEELKDKRRLVEFHRRQEDSIIHTSFKPVKVDERTQGTHCVSCILWEERNECFVTSVDTIQLLEGLVGVRFTVEEKNRIRRNLEGFKPLTVSKQKEDSESFFRLIMGFPNPKPRNIEKDVKVFPWSILGNALRKIISKYSASYASTSSILTPSTNAGYVSSAPEGGIEHHPTASPRSTASSAASHTYRMGMTSTALSSTNPGRGGLEVTSGPYEQLRQTSRPMAAMGPWATPYSSVSGLSHYATGHGHGMYEPGPPVQVTTTAAHPLHYYSASTTAEHAQHPGDKFFPPGNQPS